MSMHKKVTKPAPRYFIYRLLPLSIITVLLAACGGGSGGGSSSSHSSSSHSSSSHSSSSNSSSSNSSSSNSSSSNSSSSNSSSSHSNIKQTLNPVKKTDVSNSVNSTSQSNNTDNTHNQASNSQTNTINPTRGGNSGNSTQSNSTATTTDGHASNQHQNNEPTTSVTTEDSSAHKTTEYANNGLQKSPPTASIPKPNVDMTQNELAVYNQLNMRRTACGFGSLQSSAKLHNAAANHVNYLLYMNKYSTHGFQGHHEFKVDNYSGISNPYFTGQDLKNRIKNNGLIGSKAVPVQYNYQAAGENLSFLSFNAPYLNSNSDKTIALSSVNSLLAAPYHMASMLSPYFTEVGISYGKDKLKKDKLKTDKDYFGSILEMVLATPEGTQVTKPSEVLNYPCEGTMGTQYELTHESPNPFGNNGRNLRDKPIGQPIYIVAVGNIDVTNYKMTDAAGKQVALKALTHKNDPNKLLTKSQVILLPLSALKPSQAYRVSYQVSVDGGDKQTKSLVFHTKAKA